MPTMRQNQLIFRILTSHKEAIVKHSQNLSSSIINNFHIPKYIHQSGLFYASSSLYYQRDYHDPQRHLWEYNHSYQHSFHDCQEQQRIHLIIFASTIINLIKTSKMHQQHHTLVDSVSKKADTLNKKRHIHLETWSLQMHQQHAQLPFWTFKINTYGIATLRLYHQQYQKQHQNSTS